MGCGVWGGHVIVNQRILVTALKSLYHETVTFVVKRQAEEVGKRAPDKLRAQGNHKHKTRGRLKKRPQK